MIDRSCLRALLLAGVAFFVAGCGTSMVDSIAVSPASQSVTVGQTAQFTATGTYGHGSHPSTQQDVTDLVTWTSSSTAVATINAEGVATGVSPGTTTITATLQGFPGIVTSSATLTVNASTTSQAPEPIVALSIIPATQSVNLPGETGQFIAIATSGITGLQTNVTSTVTWSSSNVGVATITAAGLATAVSQGSTTITAIGKNPDGTVVTTTATFAVTGASSGPLLSVTIIPGSQTMAAGQQAQLIAIGTFSTVPTSQNLTSTATWGSSNPSVATVTASGGLVTAVSPGTVVITALANSPGGGVITATATFTVSASSSSAEPLASLAIVPASQTALAVGETANFIAIGTTGAGGSVNLTNQSATINSSTIKAATWTSSDPTVATINSATGVATAVSAGTAAITAQAVNPDGTVVIATATYTVNVSTTTEPLVSMAIVPGAQTLTGANQTAQFIALATTGTGPTVNLTNQTAKVGTATIQAAVWASSNPAVATVNPATGVATALTSGVTVITATASNPDGTVATGIATLTVTIAANAEPLVSLTIVPATQTASVVNQTAQFIAIGTTSSGATVNLTNQTATTGAATIQPAVWSSSSSAIATVNSATGVATALSSGTVAITAVAKNPDGTVVTGVATFNVLSTPEPLISLTIVPGTQAATATSQALQYVVIGTTSSGATVNLTNQPATINGATIAAAAWTSSNTAVGTINAATGVAASVANGTTVILATAKNPDGTTVTATATLTVAITATPETLVSLAIVPAAQTASVVGQIAQYIAIGTTSSGTTVNLTNQTATVGTTTIQPAVWGSSSVAIGAINSATGVATAVSSGSVAITAVAKNPDGSVVTGSATFTVTAAPEPLISLTIVPAAQTASSASQTLQYVVIGTTSTGATVNLTNQSATINGATIAAAVWSSSNSAVGTINASTGVATSVVNGTTVILATAKNPDGTTVTGTATLTVAISAASESLVSLAIVPATQTTSVVGQTAQYIAIGTTSTGTTVNLTNQTATVGTVTIQPAVWSSSSAAIATINSAAGTATAVSSGTVAITAVAKNPDGTVVTGSATFTVTATPEPLVSLAIVPAAQTASTANQLFQYVVIGTTSSGATVNLTNQSATINGATIAAAAWTSSDPAVGTVNALTGVATSITNGTTVILATTKNPDGTAVTASATLTVDITAASEPLVSLAIVPAAQTASVVGQAVQYIAIGTTSTGSTVNLTNQTATVGTATIQPAVWGSSSTAYATINSATGVATAVSSGSVAITAVAKNPDGTVVTGTATFTLTANPEPLVSVALVPSASGTELTEPGQTVQYIALGTTASGATVNLTSKPATIGSAIIQPVIWSSSTLSVGTVGSAGIAGSSPGLAVAGITGVTGITAIAYNPDGTAVAGTSALTVCDKGSSTVCGIPEPIVSLAIVPGAQFGFSINQANQFVAIGTTSTGTTVNLTSQSATVGSATIQPAVWSSSNPTIASATVGGVVSALGAGSTAITAAVQNPDLTVVTGTAAYTVTLQSTPEPLVSMVINPSTQTISTIGGTADLTAIATTGTGPTVNLTNQPATVGTAIIQPAVWTSSDPGIATVNQATGVVTAVSAGVTAITATASNPDGTFVTGTSVVTVPSTSSGTGTSGTVASITIIPGTQAVVTPNQTANFIAIGTTTTGATIDLTDQVAWSSSSLQIATIETFGGVDPGLATGVGQGSATITAVYTIPATTNVITGTAQFSVVGAAVEQYTALTIIPSAETISASQQVTQLIALATSGTTGLSADVTNSTAIKWSSSLPDIASVSATGLVTGKAQGVTTITAELTNTADGSIVAGTSTITASLAVPPEPILSLTIVPASITVGVLQATGQFLAIGTFSSVPYVRDLTNSPTTTWISSDPEGFPVNTNSGGNPGSSAGLVTAYTSGSALIIAESASSDGTIETATAPFNCPLLLPPPPGSTSQTPGTCYPGQPLASGLLDTLTVYNEGTNDSGWLVTAPSATGTGSVLHCGPGSTSGGSVCTATYPLNASVLLTAPAESGVSFGGWSYNCTPTDANGVALPGPVFYTAAGPNYCAVSLASNDTVGGIFNNPTLSVTLAGVNSADGLVTSGTAPSFTIDCGKGSTAGTAGCSSQQTPNSTVTLTETPNGSTFTGWTGCASTTATTCTVDMTTDVSVTASFN